MIAKNEYITILSFGNRMSTFLVPIFFYIFVRYYKKRSYGHIDGFLCHFFKNLMNPFIDNNQGGVILPENVGKSVFLHGYDKY